MAKPVLIVIGASAGGVEALTGLVSALPRDLLAAVCVVLHIPSFSRSMLPKILERAGPLPAQRAEHGAVLEAGCIYVAPPDHHLLVANGHLRLSRSPRENGHRPAVDPLFRSAANAYGQRVIGVVLSGTLDDGALGLALIKSRGGLALVQDPQDAIFDSMPRSAIENVPVDLVLPRDRLGAELARLARQLATQPEKEVDPMQLVLDPTNEAAIVAGDKLALERGERPGEPTLFTCPDCGGVLWELGHDDMLRFRCHLGHAYSPESMQAGQAATLDSALWTALRMLEESAALSRRMANGARSANNLLSAGHFEKRAAEQERRASVVRQALGEDAPSSEGSGARIVVSPHTQPDVRME